MKSVKVKRVVVSELPTDLHIQIRDKSGNMLTIGVARLRDRPSIGVVLCGKKGMWPK